MPRMTKSTIRQHFLSALLAFPGLSLAGEAMPADYLGDKQLVLEIRYCECEAIKPDGHPADLSPEFLRESRALKVAVAAGDHGFVGSGEVSIGYELDLDAEASGEFAFSYAGTYTTTSGSSTGQGQFVLKKGQWANLFGSVQETGTGSLHSNVAVRLIEPGDS